MTARARRKPSSPLANILLVVASIVCSIVIAEAAVRIIDDQPLLAFPLPEPIGLADVNPKIVDQIPRAAEMPLIKATFEDVFPLSLSPTALLGAIGINDCV